MSSLVQRGFTNGSALDGKMDQTSAEIHTDGFGRAVASRVVAVLGGRAAQRRTGQAIQVVINKTLVQRGSWGSITGVYSWSS